MTFGRGTRLTPVGTLYRKEKVGIPVWVWAVIAILGLALVGGHTNNDSKASARPVATSGIEIR